MAISDQTQGIGAGASQGAKSGATIGGPVGGAIGAVFGGLAGGMMGASVGAKKAQYETTFAKYMAELQSLDMPRYEALKLSLERYAKGEPLSPEQLNALQEVDSEVSKISYDKQAKQTQLDALAALKARSRGGLTLQDKADLMTAQREIDRQQSGVQKSILQNMQARGVAGSGVEMAQRMAAQQQGAQMASQNALQTAANSQNRALQAIKDSAQLGRQIGQDQMDFDKMKAQSVDDTRRRNLERQQQTMQFNVSNKNAANQLNWNRANTVADKNVDLGNEEQEKNKQLMLDDYYRQADRISGKYEQLLGRDTRKVDEAKRQMAGTINAIGSVGDLVGGIGSKK